MYMYVKFINRRRMRRKVTVAVGSFCLSVTTKSDAYLVYTSKVRWHMVLCCVFRDFVVWLSLKTLH
jgi:hypothetical protein